MSGKTVTFAVAIGLGWLVSNAAAQVVVQPAYVVPAPVVTYPAPAPVVILRRPPAVTTWRAPSTVAYSTSYMSYSAPSATYPVSPTPLYPVNPASPYVYRGYYLAPTSVPVYGTAYPPAVAYPVAPR